MNKKTMFKEFENFFCGKTVAISGATGGIGRELCDYLASFGASLVLLDRNFQKSTDLIKTLKEKYNNLSAKHVTVDLEDIKSVNKAVFELSSVGIDVLILNAGAYHIPRHKCKTGYDNVFQINFVSPYFLAKKVLESKNEKPIKVIAVSSIAHNYSKININDIDFSNVQQSSLVYGNAKRYLTFALQELNEKSNNISIVHPGITFTNITNHYPKLVFALIKHPMKVIFMKPRRAALSVLFGAVCQTKMDEWIGPKLFNIWGLPKKKSLKTCNESEKKQIFTIAEKIYDECEKLVQI